MRTHSAGRGPVSAPSIHTLAVHGGRPSRPDPYGAHVAPLYQTSTFALGTAEAGRLAFAGEEGGANHVYSRLGNPTVEALEDAIAGLEGMEVEGAAALAFGSGMAAITTTLLAAADRGAVLAQVALYGCTSEYLSAQAPAMGLDVRWFDPTAPAAEIEAVFAREPGIGLVYLETPANPTMSLCDLRHVCSVAHRHGALVAVDNTFATPFHQRPLALGADLVIHSTTKALGGHGTVIGGAVVAKDAALLARIAAFRKNLGGIAGPFDAWLLLNGIRTFAVRMERHAANAHTIAAWLERHPAVARVHYPGLPSHPQHALARRQMQNGFGGLLAFELAGGYDAGVRFLDGLRLCTLAVSLGTTDTLVQHPASMTHSVMTPEMRARAGIGEGLIRLSAGLEDVGEIIADLEQALEGCEAPRRELKRTA